MIEVEIVNSGNPYKAAKLRLPEEPAVLGRKLRAIGAEEREYEITNVRCYPGGLEALVTKHTSIAFLNQLALRLQKLPVSLLDQMEAFLEAKSDCTFPDLFCLLDQWERPEHLREAIPYPKAAAEEKPALRIKEPVLTVALYPKEPDCVEADILLSLPASYWSVQDGLHRLGVEAEAALLIYFVDCPRLPVFSDWLWSQTEQGRVLGTLSEWNYLALLLESMDPFAEKRLEALAESLEEARTDTIQAVIGFVLWALDGVFLENILDDAALGKFCLENGYLKDQAWRLEQMKDYLDYSQIGKEWREADGGIYTPIGYLTGAPEQPPTEAPAFLVPDGDCFLEICLESVDGEKETVLFPKDQARYNLEAWQRILSMTESVSIDCVVPTLIPIIYEDLSELASIKTLGRRFMELEQAGELPKFQAMLELWNEPDLEGALAASDQLEDYQYFGDCRSAHCFGRKLFELQCNLKLTEEERETIQFGRYGDLMAARLGAVETAYGYLLPKEGWIAE